MAAFLSDPWIEDAFVYASSFDPADDASDLGHHRDGDDDDGWSPSQDEVGQTDNTLPSGLLPSQDGDDAGRPSSARAPSRRDRIVQVHRRGGDFGHFDAPPAPEGGDDEDARAASCPPYLVLHDGRHAALAFLSPAAAAGLDGRHGIPPSRSLVSIGHYTLSTVLQCCSTAAVRSIAAHDFDRHKRVLDRLLQSPASLVSPPDLLPALRAQIHPHLYSCLYLQAAPAFVGDGGGTVGTPVDVHCSPRVRQALRESERQAASGGGADGSLCGDLLLRGRALEWGVEGPVHHAHLQRLECCHVGYKLREGDPGGADWPWASRLEVVVDGGGRPGDALPPTEAVVVPAGDVGGLLEREGDLESVLGSELEYASGGEDAAPAPEPAPRRDADDDALGKGGGDGGRSLRGEGGEACTLEDAIVLREALRGMRSEGEEGHRNEAAASGDEEGQGDERDDNEGHIHGKKDEGPPPGSGKKGAMQTSTAADTVYHTTDETNKRVDESAAIDVVLQAPRDPAERPLFKAAGCSATKEGEGKHDENRQSSGSEGARGDEGENIAHVGIANGAADPRSSAAKGTATTSRTADNNDTTLPPSKPLEQGSVAELFDRGVEQIEDMLDLVLDEGQRLSHLTQNDKRTQISVAAVDDPQRRAGEELTSTPGKESSPAVNATNDERARENSSPGCIDRQPQHSQANGIRTESNTSQLSQASDTAVSFVGIDDMMENSVEEGDEEDLGKDQVDPHDFDEQLRRDVTTDIEQYEEVPLLTQPATVYESHAKFPTCNTQDLGTQDDDIEASQVLLSPASVIANNATAMAVDSTTPLPLQIKEGKAPTAPATMPKKNQSSPRRQHSVSDSYGPESQIPIFDRKAPPETLPGRPTTTNATSCRDEGTKQYTSLLSSVETESQEEHFLKQSMSRKGEMESKKWAGNSPERGPQIAAPRHKEHSDAPLNRSPSLTEALFNGGDDDKGKGDRGATTTNSQVSLTATVEQASNLAVAETGESSTRGEDAEKERKEKEDEWEWEEETSPPGRLSQIPLMTLSPENEKNKHSELNARLEKEEKDWDGEEEKRAPRRRDSQIPLMIYKTKKDTTRIKKKEEKLNGPRVEEEKRSEEEDEWSPSRQESQIPLMTNRTKEKRKYSKPSASAKKIEQAGDREEEEWSSLQQQSPTHRTKKKKKHNNLDAQVEGEEEEWSIFLDCKLISHTTQKKGEKDKPNKSGVSKQILSVPSEPPQIIVETTAKSKPSKLSPIHNQRNRTSRFRNEDNAFSDAWMMIVPSKKRNRTPKTPSPVATTVTVAAIRKPPTAANNDSKQPLFQPGEHESSSESQMAAGEGSEETNALPNNQLQLQCQQEQSGSDAKKPLAAKRRLYCEQDETGGGGDGNHHQVEYLDDADAFSKGNTPPPRRRQSAEHSASPTSHGRENVPKESRFKSNSYKTKKKDVPVIDLAATLEKCERLHGL